MFSQLARVSMAQGAVIYEAETQIDHVYFPETAVFSILCEMENGDTVEVGPVGNEGLVGLPIFFQEKTSLDRVIVHVAGDAMRLRATALTEELSNNASALPEKVLRYTQMLLAMTARSGACNKLHRLEQQLARWMLLMSDYVGDELHLTHELIALTLGVRRAGVTVAANGFRTAGLIGYQRGHIEVLDRVGLEALACECYQIIKRDYEHLYSDLSRPAK